MQTKFLQISIFQAKQTVNVPSWLGGGGCVYKKQMQKEVFNQSQNKGAVLNLPIYEMFKNPMSEAGIEETCDCFYYRYPRRYSSPNKKKYRYCSSSLNIN